MTSAVVNEPTGADMLLARLLEHGIDTVFANAGTDFPPLVEAVAKLGRTGPQSLRVLSVPHENLAVSMAYGHYLVSGKPQAIMLHVNVGTANALCALMNAYRERIPLIVAAGRTPFTEIGHRGSRSLFIHWSQEMFDQAGLVRESVKWDYEIKMPELVNPALDRAFAIAMSDPKGPVYLTMPREILAASAPIPANEPAPLRAARRVAAEPAAIAEAADILAAAMNPVVITASLGHNAAAVAGLAALAEAFAIPVVSHIPKSLCISTEHPMHLGFAPTEFVREADAILVLECDVPWIPQQVAPRPAAKVIHMGLDPLFARYGIRNFPCALAIPGDPALSLQSLSEALASRLSRERERLDARRLHLAQRRAAARRILDEQYERVRHERPIHPIALTRAIDRIKGDAIFINELGAQVAHLRVTKPGTYFQQSSAGGLGWGLGAALGAKLADPDRLVISAMGDGSYMFGNPTPAHYMARAYDLPILVIVANNGGWGSVRSETEAMYPAGASGGAQQMPFADLHSLPDFERVIEASGGYGQRVTDPQDLGPALERALDVVQTERRQALVNVICRMV